MEFILSHEHAVVRSPGVWESYPQTVDRASVHARLVREFRQAKDNGVTAIVDVTTLDLGRETAMVEAAAAEASMRVVHATGVWLDVPRLMWPRSGVTSQLIDDIASLFMHDIREGITGAGVKAGVIKLASESGHVEPGGKLFPKMEAAFRAGARAAKASNTPITTHTDATQLTGFAQIAAFEAEGVDPSQVAIGHSTTGDITYLVSVVERGYYLSMDTFGYLDGMALQLAIERVAELCRLGWSHRVMLGHDYCAYIDWGGMNEESLVSGWCRIPQDVAPALEQAGVTPDQLTDVCARTARNFFRL